MALDFITAFYIVFSIIGTIFFFLLIGGGTMLYRREWLRINHIDFIIFDLNKGKNMSARHEKGRKIILPAKNGNKGGEMYVSAKNTLRSVKETLGNLITDNDLVHSTYGPKRKMCVLAHKDGVYTPMKITDNPDSLSLTPIRAEALNTVLAAKDFAATAYSENKNRFMEVMASAAAIALIILIIGIIIIFVLAMTQGPDFVKGIRPPAQNIPPPQ